ncbi:hypothetical protein MRX96_032476 [Rhipicephalus microplus]
MSSNATALTERQPNSIEEFVNFFGDLEGGPAAFPTEVEWELAKVASSNTKIVTELGSVRDSIAFMNESLDHSRTDADAFRKEIDVVKVESAQYRKESELRRDLI